MLKGHVFSKQIFGNPIFALFINTFLKGNNGVSNNYKNGMKVTYSGSNVTVDSGAICIQGRFLEEDTSTTIAAGTTAAFCKLVIEIDLNKQNTESSFVQGAYKIIKGASAYPNLTQNNIVKNNAGIYQYELARFKTGTSGITNFEDKRTFLNFDSIYSVIDKEYKKILANLESELRNVKDGSEYILKDDILIINTSFTIENDLPYVYSWLSPEGIDLKRYVLISVGFGRPGKEFYYGNIPKEADKALGDIKYCLRINDSRRLNLMLQYNYLEESSVECDCQIVLMRLPN